MTVLELDLGLNLPPTRSRAVAEYRKTPDQFRAASERLGCRLAVPHMSPWLGVGRRPDGHPGYEQRHRDGMVAVPRIPRHGHLLPARAPHLEVDPPGADGALLRPRHQRVQARVRLVRRLRAIPAVTTTPP